MNELYGALAALEKERGISTEYMLTQIEKAIVIACKNSYGGNEDAWEGYNKVFEKIAREID